MDVDINELYIAISKEAENHKCIATRKIENNMHFVFLYSDFVPSYREISEELIKYGEKAHEITHANINTLFYYPEIILLDKANELEIYLPTQLASDLEEAYGLLEMVSFNSKGEAPLLSKYYSFKKYTEHKARNIIKSVIESENLNAKETYFPTTNIMLLGSFKELEERIINGAYNEEIFDALKKVLEVPLLYWIAMDVKYTIPREFE